MMFAWSEHHAFSISIGVVPLADAATTIAGEMYLTGLGAAVSAAALLFAALAEFFRRAFSRQKRTVPFIAEGSRADERYRAFIENTAEAIWRFELEQPVPVAMSEDQQIEMYYRHSYLAECNRAMAQIYGFDHPQQMVGMRLNDILPRENPTNIEFLRRFIRSGYHLIDAESDDVDRHGNIVHALNNLFGVVENGYGVRVWGTNRDITDQRRRQEEAITRERQQTALAELSQRAVTDTNVPAVIDRAAKLVQQTLGVDFVSVLEFQPDRNLFVMRAGIGWETRHSQFEIIPADLGSQAGFTMLTSPKVSREGIQTHEPIVFADIRTDTRFANSRLKAQGVVSAVTVMIHGEHHPYGMLGAYTATKRPFSKDQVEFVQAVANLIAAVMIRQSGHEALRRSEAQNRTLVEQVKEYAIFMIDPTGRAISWNEGVKRVLGYDEHEFIGKPSSNFFAAADIARNVPQREIDEAIQLGQSHNDRWMVRKDGSRFWASGITTALRDEYGRLLGFAKVMRDQTDQRRFEMQLRRSERSLSAAQRIAHIGNWELELNNLNEIDANSLIWSDEVFRIFGYKPGEFEPSNERFFASVHPDDREAIKRNLQAALHGPGVYNVEHRIILPNGGERTVHEQAEVEYDSRGRPWRVIGTVQDISERKRAEAELDQYRNHLEQLVAHRSSELEESHRRLRHTERMAALGTLSAGLGHDMGNLLLPIRVRLDAIESKTKHDAIAEDMRVIRTAAEYLQRLSNGLRMLAVDVDRAPYGESTNLEAWWLDADPILKNALPRGVRLTADFAADVPVLHISRHHLMQIVFNLVQNAGDALRDDPSGEVRVWARRFAASNTVHLGVTDNGVGMSAEVKRRCLEPFFTTKTRSISTGLGLALVHGIVRQAGGQLEIDSAVGRGTAVTLIFPQASALKPHTGQAIGDRRPIATVSLSDPRMRSFTSAVLNASGYQVMESSGATSAEGELWITDADAGRVELAEQFLSGAPQTRHVVLFGNATEGLDHPRILQLGDQPKPAMVRQALHDIASQATSTMKRAS